MTTGDVKIMLGGLKDAVWSRRVWPCGCIDSIAPLYADHGSHQKVESDAWNLFFDREYCETHVEAEQDTTEPPLPMLVMLYRVEP